MKPLVYKMFINICGLRYTGLFLRFKLNKLMNGWPFLPKRAMRYIIPLVYDGLGTAQSVMKNFAAYLMFSEKNCKDVQVCCTWTPAAKLCI